MISSFEHNNRYTNNAASINSSSTYHLIDDGSFLKEVDLHYGNVDDDNIGSGTTHFSYPHDMNNHTVVQSITTQHRDNIIGYENENGNENDDDDNLRRITPSNFHPSDHEIIIEGSFLNSNNDNSNSKTSSLVQPNFFATAQHNDNRIVNSTRSYQNAENFADSDSGQTTKTLFTNNRHNTTHDFYPYYYAQQGQNNHAQEGHIKSAVINCSAGVLCGSNCGSNNGVLTDHVDIKQQNTNEETAQYRFAHHNGVAPVFKQPTEDTSLPRASTGNTSSTTTNLHHEQRILSNTNEKIDFAADHKFSEKIIDGLRQSTTTTTATSSNCTEPVSQLLLVHGFDNDSSTTPTYNSYNGNENITTPDHHQHQEQQQQQQQSLLIDCNQQDSKDKSIIVNCDLGIDQDEDENGNETNINKMAAKIIVAQPPQRRRSRAIAINKRSRPGDESATAGGGSGRHQEEGNGELYDYATWRMYNRITDHRRKSSLLLSLQASAAAAAAAAAHQEGGGRGVSSSSAREDDSSGDSLLLLSNTNGGREQENRSNSSGLTLSMGTNSSQLHPSAAALQQQQGQQQQRNLLHAHHVPSLVGDYYHISETAIFDLEL